MKQREMNFIRSTARGILRAMDDFKATEDKAVIQALADMTKPVEHLRSEDVGYYATMYLIAHDWEVPD